MAVMLQDTKVSQLCLPRSCANDDLQNTDY